MNKRIISMILLVSMLIFSLFGCSNFTSKKAITADTPYYSVTTGSYEQDRNVYMDLDIKIPKITYSNTDGNELMDSLNKDIESSTSCGSSFRRRQNDSSSACICSSSCLRCICTLMSEVSICPIDGE